jgi:hypothetical protein
VKQPNHNPLLFFADFQPEPTKQQLQYRIRTITTVETQPAVETFNASQINISLDDLPALFYMRVCTKDKLAAANIFGQDAIIDDRKERHFFVADVAIANVGSPKAANPEILIMPTEHVLGSEGRSRTFSIKFKKDITVEQRFACGVKLQKEFDMFTHLRYGQLRCLTSEIRFSLEMHNRIREACKDVIESIFPDAPMYDPVREAQIAEARRRRAEREQRAREREERNRIREVKRQEREKALAEKPKMLSVSVFKFSRPHLTTPDAVIRILRTLNSTVFEQVKVSSHSQFNTIIELPNTIKEKIPTGVFQLGGTGTPWLQIVNLLSQTLVLADAQ